MIDCSKCYRFKIVVNKAYCPFLGLNPCYRGFHYLNLNGLQPIGEKYKRILIVPKSKSAAYPYTNRIIKAVKNNDNIAALARDINVDVNVIRDYILKLMDYNNINVETFRIFEFEVLYR